LTRLRLAALLFVASGGLYLAVVPPAHREREAAEQERRRVLAEAQRLRLRVASVSRLSREGLDARASDGVAAVRALRAAALRATDGVSVSEVEIAPAASPHGAVAARCRVKVRGRQADVLRVARRLARPSSGLLLDGVTLAASREDVVLEAEVFILRENP
jgi:hypothetical protein